MDGSVKCFSLEGKNLWTADIEKGFPYDLCVRDIDNDGLDEVLVASANGSLFAFDNDGGLLWKFSGIPPLYQVTVAYDSDGKPMIYTGGVGEVLYALDSYGKPVDSLDIGTCIRHLRSGRVSADGRETLALASTSGGLSARLSLQLINPADLSVIWKNGRADSLFTGSAWRFFSMDISDLDGDNREEIILGNSWQEKGSIFIVDYTGQIVRTPSDRSIPGIPYRMNLVRHIKTKEDRFILGHYGNVMIVYETEGKVREVFRIPYSFADSYYDEELSTLFMGSAISGGDEVYAFQPGKPGWQDAMKNLQPIGKIAEIEKNLSVLREQITNFSPPSYQPAPSGADAITRRVDSAAYQNVSFARNITMTQRVDQRDELWCREMDQRMPYRATADELVGQAREFEANGTDTYIWAGHGYALYFPLSTFEKLIKAAPRHLKGFVFAEMEGTDERMREIVSQLLLPIAELCKQNGKVIIFRNKNIFWSGSCYLPLWKEVLLNDRYSDVFVPGLEETNCRTQELSLSGRVGLWQTDCFDRWACRIVTDNSNFDRVWEWGGQQVITHHLRNLVSNASMGADLFFTDIHAGDDAEKLHRQLIPFYQMLEKGIIQIPSREQLISVSDMALGMMSPPSRTYIDHGTNGHGFNYRRAGNPEMVFNQLDTYWSGSTLPSWDYSSYAMNVRQRVTNFMPETPYGLTPVIPAGLNGNGRFKTILLTDGEFFFDKEGKRYSPQEYKPVVLKALEESAKRLPLLVKGDIHWTAAKLDDKHLRITLVDPGYFDPAKRSGEIVLQHLEGESCTDILSGEKLKIKNNRIQVTVPAGVFRILDLAIK
jgi:hypothetical protein